jgi:outer membrane protein assembly factor BamD
MISQCNVVRNPGAFPGVPARGFEPGARWRMPRVALTMILALGFLAACSFGGDDDEPTIVERPVEQLYNDAMNVLENDRFKAAATMFEEVERQHPYSIWATRAQLMAAYAYYQNNDYDDAIIALDRFIQLHPSNVGIPYAHYLKGLSFYEQISDVSRDQKMTESALKAFSELIARYPKSRYARDAKLKVELTYNHLAGKEMNIGRYYLNQGNYLAAINRFKAVIENYQTTTHVPEALHRLTEAYRALGIEDEARKTASVLGHNFPGSEWYVDSYELIENKQVREDKLREKPWYKFW